MLWPFPEEDHRRSSLEQHFRDGRDERIEEDGVGPGFASGISAISQFSSYMTQYVERSSRCDPEDGTYR